MGEMSEERNISSILNHCEETPKRLEEVCDKCISDMHVGTVSREWAYSVEEGEGIHLVVFGAVISFGKVLKVLKDMKAAYVMAR